MKPSVVRTSFLGALLVSALLPGVATAQGVPDILRTYMELHESRLADIEDVLLIQSIMGIPNELYMEKVEEDGNTVLRPRAMRAQGMMMPVGPESTEGNLTDASAYLFELANRAEVAGTEVVDGAETTIIAVDDLSGIDFAAPTQDTQQQPMEARSIQLFLDTSAWVIRRMMLIADVTTPNGPREATLVADFGDFREVEGMVHPFHVVTTMTGMGGSVSPESIAEAERTVEDMEEQLASMPEEQRRMVEQVLSDQMEEVLAMLATGSMTVEVEVREIRVNEGPPEV